jgi:ribosomal protein S18 acetylase RimI-like enzyme
MMMSPNLLALLLLVICGLAQTLVISPRTGNGGTPTLANTNQEVDQCRKLKIRSTIESDIPEISHILASSLMDSEILTGFNFNAKIKLLKRKAGVDSLLRSRIQAIESGKTIECPIELEENDYLRFLWSNEKFRNRVEKSALLSKEPHVWTDHNFACAPESSCWLQHKMITAVDASTGDVVGFCEVAMLSRPLESDEQAYAPTIINLVTSPKYRRQGIATRVMQSASRFVRQEWGFGELSLYVAVENEAAIALYQTMGYGQVQQVERDSSFQLYMAKHFVPSYA